MSLPLVVCEEHSRLPLVIDDKRPRCWHRLQRNNMYWVDVLFQWCLNLSSSRWTCTKEAESPVDNIAYTDNREYALIPTKSTTIVPCIPSLIWSSNFKYTKPCSLAQIEKASHTSIRHGSHFEISRELGAWDFARAQDMRGIVFPPNVFIIFIIMWTVCNFF